tara:strand:+ start:493 stop:666 length:174 start_codon:yes stop_codon:yes gene_type:complete
MKKFLIILLFLTSCSVNQEISNQEILFNDQMTIDEFKLKLNEYVKKSKFPNIDENEE